MKYVWNRRLIGILGLLILIGASLLWGCIPGRDQEPAKLAKYDEEPRISVYMHETGEKREMMLEDYLLGVVAGEVGGEDWPIETLAAQAIIARSFTMEFINRGGTKESRGTDISTDETEAQAYAAAKISDDIREAVRRTRGEVMTYKGNFARSWFHSYSGGITATPSEGLNFKGGDVPYVRSVKLPKNEFAPDEVTNWSASFALDEISRALRAKGIDVGQISDLRVLSKGATGRATEILIKGSNGEHRMHGADFRVALDPQKLRSTLFTRFEVEGNNLVAEGTGYGHGVGLSQWDAFMFAKEGLSPEDIVRRFFEGIEIKKLWD